MDFISILSKADSTEEQRIQAIFQLMNNDDPKAVEAIRHALYNDPSPIVRHEAAYTLGEMNQEAEKYLSYTIKNDTNEFVIHEAALALGNLGTEGYREVIEELLEHEDKNVADTAEIALKRWYMKKNGEVYPGKADEVILNPDLHPEHRIQASFDLLEDNTKHAIDKLLEALENEANPIVKHEIIFCLGEVATTKVVKPLVRHMHEDDNPFVKHEAALALATIGDTSVAADIEKLLKHKNKDVVESAQIALERLLKKQIIET